MYNPLLMCILSALINSFYYVCCIYTNITKCICGQIHIKDITYKDQRKHIRFCIDGYDYIYVETDAYPMPKRFAPDVIGCDTEHVNKPVVLTATSGCGKDITDKVNMFAGPNNDFFKQEGYPIRLRDLLVDGDTCTILDSTFNNHYFEGSDTIIKL